MELYCLFIAFTLGLFLKNTNEVNAFRGGLESASEDCNDMWQTVISKLPVDHEKNVVLGDKGVLLNCFNNNNNEKVTWFYNSQNISNGGCGIFKCQVLSNGSLEIFKPNDYNIKKKKNEKHEYYCTRNVTIGVLQSIVRSPPVFLTIADFPGNVNVYPEKIKTHEGELVRFECNVDSTPPAIITWFHNGKHIEIPENSDKFFLGQFDELYINSTEQSNSGSYHCSAKNKYTYDDEKTSNLAVLDVTRRPDKILHEKKLSIFIERQQLQEVMNGERLKIICASSGYPLPIVNWIVFNSSGIHELSSDIGINVLDIKNATTIHTGEYYCDVNNKKGDNPMSKVTVKVGTLPYKKDTVKNQVIKTKNRLTFKCKIHGNPKPQITWFKNTQKIQTNERIFVNPDSSILYIRNVENDDTGVYQCFGTNRHGVYTAAVEFQYDHMKSPEWIPTSVGCKAKSDTEIAVSWVGSLLSSKLKTIYTVHRNEVGIGKNDNKSELSTATNGTSVVLKGLKNHQNYSVSIRSWSLRRCSKPSLSVTCATLPSIPKKEDQSINGVDDKTILTTVETPAADIILGVIIGSGISILFIIITYFYIRFLKKRFETTSASSCPDGNSTGIFYRDLELTESQESSRHLGYRHSLGIVYEEAENRIGCDSEDFLLQGMTPTDFNH